MAQHGKDNLEPPPRTSIDDPGAHDLDSDSDDHFSDAQSERHSPNSPIPLTRVERVDSEPRYGEVPGTAAYNMRTEDARPDEIAVIRTEDSNEPVQVPFDRPTTPGGHPIPTTVVEKVESVPSCGDPPIASGHKTLLRDAALKDAHPDGSATGLQKPFNEPVESGPIPVTRVEKVDSIPTHGEVPGTDAYEMRKADAQPDIVKEVGDVKGSPTFHGARFPPIDPSGRRSSIQQEMLETGSDARAAVECEESEAGDNGAGSGDDFDDFEEGGEDAEFGDFDGGFREVRAVPVPSPQSLPTITPSIPVLNFDDLDTPEETLTATEPYIEAIFPSDTIDLSTLPQPPHDNPIFLTQRSASLWSQLVAPPPLQPPNWIRSRIRRLFLVSLGVPIDLDEILPASKQKKLILPSTYLSKSSSPRTSQDSRAAGSVSRLRQSDGNTSSTSLDSQGKPSSSSKRRKGGVPVPELDLVYARQLCSITDQALDGLTNEELQLHVEKLEGMQGTAKEVLEYWRKRTDQAIGDREAFEGVIENLVKHARKVRK